jgi:hypothetical protein
MSCTSLLQSGKRKGEACGRIQCGYHKTKVVQVIPKEKKTKAKEKRVVRLTTRPTLSNVKHYYEQLPTYTFDLNKDDVELFLKRHLGISSAKVDGEIKCFPLKPSLLVKESLAITRMDVTMKFEDSPLYQALKQTLFIPYVRNGNSVSFLPSVLFTMDHELFPHFKKDYETLKTGKNGKYIQTRINDESCYLRTCFLTALFKTQ